MIWNNYIKAFQNFLVLERGLSEHTIDAYLRDIHKLMSYDQSAESPKGPLLMDQKEIQYFLGHIHDLGVAARTQARILSGIKTFYKFLVYEDLIDNDPTELIQGPKLSKKIPDVLSIEEIDLLMSSIDLSLPQGHRNRAILETLYACGLRVSELINLQLSNYYPSDGYIKVIGKGNKERLVPIAPTSIQHINYYVNHDRKKLKKIESGHEDFIFLNRRGKRLTRVMIFTMIKKYVALVGIQKNVSPHTFRHSFATHLVEGGANLRSIQDMLGHESITTTEIYAHMDTKYLQETIMLYHPLNAKVK